MKKWCLGLLGKLKESGLGEPLGKASLANTIFRLGRLISMRDGSFWIGESGFGNPSEAWPDEVLERGLPRPLAKGWKNWGWQAFISLIFLA
jgi:hypothetical protein